MHKAFHLIIMCLFLGACASLITKPHEIPSPDRLFIHKNPGVGDYAVYFIKAGNFTHRYEVHEINGDLITVRYRMRYLDPDYKNLSPKEWYYRQVNLDGQVLKAWAETDTGERFSTPVARSGLIGSFEHLTKVDKLPEKPVVTKAGIFKVNNINAYIYRTDVGLISTNSSCMEYYSDDIPFRILKREMLHTADVGGFLKSMEYIKTLGESYLTENYLALYNRATQEDMGYQSTIVLMEYGYAK